MTTQGEAKSPLTEETFVEATLQLTGLIEKIVTAGDLGTFAENVLPGLAALAHSEAMFLHVGDTRLLAPRFFYHKLPTNTATTLRQLCREQFDQMTEENAGQPLAVSSELVLYPLHDGGRFVGLLGMTRHEDGPLSPALWDQMLRLFTSSVSRLTEHVRSERTSTHLNAYLTISSMLAQSLGLQDILELALYNCMEMVSAEAASILLLDDDRENLSFYLVEGPAKPALVKAVIPADKGVAGSVLQSQQPEIVNDARGDPRLYRRMDWETGFLTRNMIAIPLIAGEEQVGVLEVLNKADGKDFQEEEKLLLVMIAEEIAFAVRNAKVFEYVVNSYCKQRQGQSSCRGCKRPLGSWTPCVKYREAAV